MALQLLKTTKYGVDANYWKISEVHINLLSQSAQIVVMLFKDQASAANREPIDNVTYIWNGADFPFSGGAQNIQNVIYTKLKGLSEWAGAADV